MDGPGDYHLSSEGSQTEKKQASYDIIYMHKLKKKLYKWTYLQNRNRLTDLENKLMVTRREGRQAGTDWELWIDMYTLLYLE